MEKVEAFFKWFNRPAQILETIGYITVFIGLICMAFGIIQIPSCSVGPSTSVGTSPLPFLVIGAAFTFIVPQLFFAIAKVVKAAEKYLGEE